LTQDKKKESSENYKEEQNKENQIDIAESKQAENVKIEEPKRELSELKDKYLRLYADFENYKRVTAKDREELIKYSNEELIKELLSVIDHLELALQHSPNNNASTALAEGVKMTLKELQATLEKFGVVSIEALGKPFDPFVHHAMSQIESEENNENTVVEEFRKGYMLKDRVLRATLVGVSKKPSQKLKIDTEEE